MVHHLSRIENIKFTITEAKHSTEHEENPPQVPQFQELVITGKYGPTPGKSRTCSTSPLGQSPPSNQPNQNKQQSTGFLNTSLSWLVYFTNYLNFAGLEHLFIVWNKPKLSTTASGTSCQTSQSIIPGKIYTPQV